MNKNCIKDISLTAEILLYDIFIAAHSCVKILGDLGMSYDDQTPAVETVTEAADRKNFEKKCKRDRFDSDFDEWLKLRVSEAEIAENEIDKEVEALLEAREEREDELARTILVTPVAPNWKILKKIEIIEHYFGKYAEDATWREKLATIGLAGIKCDLMG
jgi:DNA-binding transcriptional regulator GbsR (MarR family)